MKATRAQRRAIFRAAADTSRAAVGYLPPMLTRCFSPGAGSLALSLLVACGGGTSSGDSNGFGGAKSSSSSGAHATSGSSGGGGGAGGGAGSGGGNIFVGSATGSGGGTTQSFDVEPKALQTITVTAGQTMPTVAFTATLDGKPINAGWSVDRGNLGTIPAGPSDTATFTPTGTTGGLVTVIAGLNGQTISRQVFVKLTAQQNGSNPAIASEAAQIPGSAADLSKGGGVGGVGGDGLGPAVSDATILASLVSPNNDGSAQQLQLLYPYDKTVWPRGMLAPLLQWSWSVGDADAIRIDLTTTSGSFAWAGTFGRPAILQKGKFIRHPIPQDIWQMATNTAGGPTADGKPDQLTVKLTVQRAGQAYGPIAQTWTIAPARLTGTVYYNSYGTQLVKNWANADGAGHPVGAAILGVRSGDTGPTLVVGKNSSSFNAQGIPTSDDGCRVCHVVSSRGRWVLTQSEQGNPGDGRSFLYDLTAADVQGSAKQLTQEGVFAWAAMTGDGSYALTNTIDPSSSNPGILNSSANTAVSSFWQFGTAPVKSTVAGLPAGVSAGYPSYSPDDKLLAYVDVAGKTSDVTGPIMMASYDSATQTFSNVVKLAAAASGQRIGYPVFLPDNSGVIFETQVRTSQTDKVMVTRDGTRSELWWVNVNGTPTPVRLATLNGLAGGSRYVPLGPNNHGASQAADPRSSYDETGKDDTTLNYEPTVLPIVEGGYAWVVFTSRRMYGNSLDAPPWRSWPPDFDSTSLDQATTKKLWVAAIDLNAPPGSDPSHPAFYLPAQEILAGNSRGFWVLDPCKTDGSTCDSGDQCCNGFCEPSGQGGALVCSNMPPDSHCSQLQEKCTAASDCCDGSALCINGFCALQSPQ